MLPTTVRLAAFAAAATPRTIAARSLLRPLAPSALQRRFSSSKPSSSDGGAGAKGLTGTVVHPGKKKSKLSAHSVPPADQQQPQQQQQQQQQQPGAASTAPAPAKARAESAVPDKFDKIERRGRKPKPAPEPLLNIPRVASTRHMASTDCAMSSFFALHRPISISQFYPEPVTMEQFNDIFEPKPFLHKHSEVMATLSQAQSSLESESAPRRYTLGGQPSPMRPSGHEATSSSYGASSPDGATQVRFKHVDGTETNMVFKSGNEAPRLPPPYLTPPAPRSAEELAATGDAFGSGSGPSYPGSGADMDASDWYPDDGPMEVRQYKATLLITETSKNGWTELYAHRAKMEQLDQPLLDSLLDLVAPSPQLQQQQHHHQQQALARMQQAEAEAEDEEAMQQAEAETEEEGAIRAEQAFTGKSFYRRMYDREQQLADAVQRRGLDERHAISVKRLRRLKMKKHKYKKLTKKTKMEREKLGQK